MTPNPSFAGQLLIADTAMHWTAIVLYAVATGINAYGIIFDRSRWERWSWAVAWAGFAAQTIALGARWIASGHGPYMAKYEVLSSYAWVLILGYLVTAHFVPAVRRSSLLVFPAAFLLIAFGMFQDPAVKKLPPTLNSIWLTLHVTFYKITFASTLIALALSLLVVLKGHFTNRFIEKLPARETMDLYAYRFAGLAFLFWAIGMLAGSIWAYYSWGSYWSWDAVETWSLITWGVMGLYLHLRRFYGWKGDRAAYLMMVTFGLVVATVFFTSIIQSSLHAVYFQ
jgi:cytochrome c-type biogenesis protein CcsB